MARFLKVLLHRPLSIADLEAASETLLKNPPLPPGPNSMFTSQGQNGKSLLEWWRESYLGDLKEIAECRTWQRQKATLIRIILEHHLLSSVQPAVGTDTPVAAWKHYVSHNPAFTAVDEAQWPTVLLHLYVTSLMSHACLEIIGSRLYEIDKPKSLELELFRDSAVQSRKLDVSLMRLGLGYAVKGERKNALDTVDAKETMLDPLIRERFDLLSEMKDAISNRSLDMEYVRRRMSEIFKKHQELTRAFQTQTVRYGHPAVNIVASVEPPPMQLTRDQFIEQFYAPFQVQCLSRWSRRSKEAPIHLATYFFEWIKRADGRIAIGVPAFNAIIEPVIVEDHRKTTQGERPDAKAFAGMVYDALSVEGIEVTVGPPAGASG